MYALPYDFKTDLKSEAVVKCQVKCLL